MKKVFVKTITIILGALLILCALTACGKKRPAEEVIQESVLYYATYGAEAEEEISANIKELKKIDQTAGDKWEKIFQLWNKVDNDIELNFDVLPDGLAKTDELALVVLGFQLNDDGTMKDELIKRLTVAKASAEKYPNSLIVCTGGGTAKNNESATEAGKMAEWLISEGIDKNRVIVEDQSITTAQNAMFTYDILEADYPQVSQLAIISSDYHIATGTLFFEAECILRGETVETQKVSVVSNAACFAQTGVLSKMFQAGGLIELSGDTETAFDIYYEEYDIHDLPSLDD